MEIPNKFRKRISKKNKLESEIMKDKEESEKILQECEMIQYNKFAIDDDESDEDDQEKI